MSYGREDLHVHARAVAHPPTLLEGGRRSTAGRRASGPLVVEAALSP